MSGPNIESMPPYSPEDIAMAAPPYPGAETGLDQSPTEKEVALEAAETALANAAAEIEIGISTRGERSAFLEAMDGYKSALGAVVLEQVDSLEMEGVPESRIRESIIETLMGSKLDVVSDASIQHSEESFIQRAKEKMIRSKVGRNAGPLAMAATFGLTVWAASKGIDTGADSLPIPEIAGMTTAVLAKSGIGAIFSNIRKSVTSEIRSHDSSDVERIMKTAESITDSEKRDEYIHEELSRMHGEVTERKLWMELGKIHLDPEQGIGYETLIAQGLETVTGSLMDIYDVDGDDAQESRTVTAAKIAGKAVSELAPSSLRTALKDSIETIPELDIRRNKAAA